MTRCVVVNARIYVYDAGQCHEGCSNDIYRIHEQPFMHPLGDGDAELSNHRSAAALLMVFCLTIKSPFVMQIIMSLVHICVRIKVG